MRRCGACSATPQRIAPPPSSQKLKWLLCTLFVPCSQYVLFEKQPLDIDQYVDVWISHCVKRLRHHCQAGRPCPHRPCLNKKAALARQKRSVSRPEPCAWTHYQNQRRTGGPVSIGARHSNHASMLSRLQPDTTRIALGLINMGSIDMRRVRLVSGNHSILDNLFGTKRARILLNI